MLGRETDIGEMFSIHSTRMSILYTWTHTHSLVSVILVSGAMGWIPLFGGGDVLEPCLEDNLLLGNVFTL